MPTNRYARKGGGSTPYIDLLKSQGYDTSGMSEEQAEEHCKFLGIEKASGALHGAYTSKNDPEYEERRKFAENYYSQITNRKRDYEIDVVAKNSNMDREDVEKYFPIYSRTSIYLERVKLKSLIRIMIWLSLGFV